MLQGLGQDQGPGREDVPVQEEVTVLKRLGPDQGEVRVSVLQGPGPD